MYNFLDPKLLPKVSCKAPSTDNYEVDNLIHPNDTVRARGFLAYTITKPPVEIEFELLCPINIRYIYLNSTVGVQRCSGVEVFARNSKNPYTSIAKAVYDTSTVIFCNARKFSNENPPQCHDSTSSLFYFRSNKFRIFTNATAIKIVIFRTERSVPCIGSIKIFGQPSRICSPTTINTINRIMGHPLGLSNEPPEKKKDSLAIPEEFTDDITCEIMALPMTLPSGNTIDRDTLEKHVENEKLYGRKPGDPFTGLKFTDTRKPVLNAALKGRIDMFLLRNRNDPVVFGVKRTLGNAPDCSNKKIKTADAQKCSGCGKSDSLYVIPCEHFYCRDCLLGIETLKCHVCHKEFAKNNAARFHN